MLQFYRGEKKTTFTFFEKTKRYGKEDSWNSKQCEEKRKLLQNFAYSFFHFCTLLEKSNSVSDVNPKQNNDNARKETQQQQ